MKAIVVVLVLLALLGFARADETTCVSDYENGSVLHFVCYCSSPQLVNTRRPEEKDGNGDKDVFSVASFAYGLSGSLFAKTIFVTFQSCRYLRVRLDQKELMRIGAPLFRPDLQVQRLKFEHVYHLELERHKPSSGGLEYLSVPPGGVVSGNGDGGGLELLVESVALVKLQRGAEFSKMVSFSNATALYIDLVGSEGDEEVNVLGFNKDRVFFVTKTTEVPLRTGESFEVKMKHLTSEMQAKSHMLSLALSLSTIVILLGIFGLIVVANHRQRKRQQLKAILRAKNLGPMLESRKIAKEVSDTFGLPNRYNQMEKGAEKSSTDNFKKKSESNKKEDTATSRFKFRSRLPDFNEFISGLMYRMRKGGEFTPEHGTSVLPVTTLKPPPPPPPKTNPPPATSSAAAPLPSRPPPPGTSFFYKESSVTATSASSSSSETSATSSASSSSSSTPSESSCGEVQHEVVEVEVNKRKREKKGKKSPNKSPSSSCSTCSSEERSTSRRSRANSYVSKISQQVFVHEAPKENGKSVPAAAKSASPPQQEAPHPRAAGDLKKPPEKCMTFFSSVTRTKMDSETAAASGGTRL